jgi:hypothetical protein
MSFAFVAQVIEVAVWAFSLWLERAECEFLGGRIEQDYQNSS